MGQQEWESGVELIGERKGRLIKPKFVVCILMITAAASTAPRRQPVSLIGGKEDTGGWGFANGAEFPGARGELKVAAERFRDKPVLRNYLKTY